MKIVIIGGVAGGATAAARLRRMDENVEITMFEKGNYISYANCGLPYHIGGSIEERRSLLLQSVEGFMDRYNIDILNNHQVTEIDATKKEVAVLDTLQNITFRQKYDKLILSPGAEPIIPPLEGIDSEGIFTLRTVPDMDRIMAHIANHKTNSAVVVGGGFIGLEMVENLVHRGIQCTLVERDEQVMAPLDYSMAAIVHKHIEEKGVKLHLRSEVASFTRDDSGSGIEVRFKDGTGVKTDLVILSIGVRPDIKLAQSAGLTIGNSRGIVVNEYMQTSDKDIYAIGDAVEIFNPLLGRNTLIPLAGPANKQARIAADNILEGNKYKYRGTIGTAVAKFFDLTVAATGLSEKAAIKENIPCQSIYLHAKSHAGYYPGAEYLSIKMIFSPDNGKVLGAMIVGKDGVSKRIDILSSFIKNSGTIYDLQDFEHAYAPPYSSAKDPVNMCGYVAQNIIEKRVKMVSWRHLEKIDPQRVFLIDLRTEQEYREGHIPGAVNYPLNELREWLDEIPKDREIIVYCLTGMRSYIGYRVLAQNGFDNVLNLAGGYMTYQYTHLH